MFFLKSVSNQNVEEKLKVLSCLYRLDESISQKILAVYIKKKEKSFQSMMDVLSELEANRDKQINLPLQALELEYDLLKEAVFLKNTHFGRYSRGLKRCFSHQEIDYCRFRRQNKSIADSIAFVEKKARGLYQKNKITAGLIFLLIITACFTLYTYLPELQRDGEHSFVEIVARPVHQ